MIWRRTLRITAGFAIPFDLKERLSFTQLLVLTAQQTHRLVPSVAQDDLGEGVVLGPCATALGFMTGLWLAAARAESGAWSSGRPHCSGLARGRERRGPRERGRLATGDRFRDPERCGQPPDPDRHAGPWGGVPV